MFLKHNNNFIKAILMKIYSKIIYNYADIIIVTRLTLKNLLLKILALIRKKLELFLIMLIQKYLKLKI